jgi:hypothetical protein
MTKPVVTYSINWTTENARRAKRALEEEIERNRAKKKASLSGQSKELAGKSAKTCDLLEDQD